MVRRSAAAQTKSAVKSLLWLMAVILLVYAGWVYVRANPENMPWTPLDLADPIGPFTAQKLAALGDDTATCKNLLDRAGAEYVALPPQGQDECRAENLLRPKSAGVLDIAYAPADVAPSCPVVSALALWEWRVVKPSARELLGSPVKRIRHFGSYSCRRTYGRSEGRWSEHATGNAIDIAAFELEDGRVIAVQRDWNGTEMEAKFLRNVRDGACGLFTTVLSPDYNAAHADHFHLDQAERGMMGGTLCR